jgi:outer membrane protein TolC
MKKLLLLMMYVAVLPMNAQTLTLEDCKQLAHDNYPTVKQYHLVEQTRDFTIENASKAWLPQISASVNGLAFTNVLDLTDQMKQAGVDMKNWMVAGSVMINQNIYDGGQVKANKNIAAAQAEVQKHQLNVNMYDLNQRVEQLYFGVLTLDEQIRQTELLQNDLALSNKTITSMISEGVANQTDLDAVKVEQVKAQQTLDAQKTSRASYLQMIGVFIGKKLGEGMVLQKPAMADVINNTDNRPEIDYYKSQGILLDAQRKQLDTKLLPKLSAFGMGVYHTSVTDMMNNGLLAGGLTLSWNIGALYTRKNDIKNIETQRRIIDSQRETFLFNNSLQNENTNGNISTLRRQISQDDDIVALRERIRSKSEKKVKLGTESINEMLRDINAVSQARQQKALHEIQLLKEIYSLKTINNN